MRTRLKRSSRCFSCCGVFCSSSRCDSARSIWSRKSCGCGSHSATKPLRARLQNSRAVQQRGSALPDAAHAPGEFHIRRADHRRGARSRPTQAASQQFGLFETALRDPMQLSETLARLTGLLGAERVGTPVLQETHRPDAFRMEPFSWQLPETMVSSRSPSQSRACGVFVPRRRPLFSSQADAAGAPAQPGGGGRSGRSTMGLTGSSGNWWDGMPRGPAPSGMCSWRMARSAVAMSTTQSVGARRNLRLGLKRACMPYVELHACSAFSFLRGGSFPGADSRSRGRAADAGGGVARSQRRLWLAKILGRRARTWACGRLSVVS